MNDLGKQNLAEAQKIASGFISDPKRSQSDDEVRLALAFISLVNELARLKDPTPPLVAKDAT